MSSGVIHGCRFLKEAMQGTSLSWTRLLTATVVSKESLLGYLFTRENVIPPPGVLTVVWVPTVVPTHL